jgi:hypothetical protein
MSLTLVIGPCEARHRKRRLPLSSQPRLGRPKGSKRIFQSKTRFEIAAMHALVRQGASPFVAAKTAVSVFYSGPGGSLERRRYIQKLYQRDVVSGKVSKSIGCENWLEVSAGLLIARAKALRGNRPQAIQMIEHFLTAMKWGERMDRLSQWTTEIDCWLAPQKSEAASSMPRLEKRL